MERLPFQAPLGWLLVNLAITVVLLLQAVGLIMVLALLSLPAALAGHHARSLGMMIVIASLAASPSDR